MTEGVALYLRVSTEQQDLRGQEYDLRTYAARRGWKIACVYAEKTSASGRVERAAHEALLLEAQSSVRGWRRVLVWSLDRWSRDPSFVRAIGSIEQLEALGIWFHSFKEPMLDSSDDPATRLGRDLIRGILPTLASFEARRRSERTAVAMRELKEGRRKTRSGRPNGRPRRISAEQVTEAIKLRKAGTAWAEVAKRVGLKAETARWAVHQARKGRTFPLGAFERSTPPVAVENPSTVEKGPSPA